MKILVLQLARLGDIYMSWPALRALRRQFPQAEIHLLTRPRFEGAVEGLTAIDRHWTLPSANIIEPLLGAEDLSESSMRLENFLAPLQNEKFDWIINLTFSPFSSYLTHALSHESTRTSGYTRFSDGYFNPGDETSAYFYAQVGIDKPNRIHIADIFASMIGIDYVEEDWAAPVATANHFQLPANYLVIHVGASERHKSVSARKWAQALQQISSRRPNTAVVLIGVASEKNISREIIAHCQGLRIFDLVGKTKISDLFSVIQSADLLIGCDSAPIHIASLTDTPTLNIS
ncbi:MAG TPA: glycosyltransferase family 9 protein, partial [Bdellovibrio sp.]|nr:glycosyltransferase family 9 protein [Bdellovibrio sp.]